MAERPTALCNAVRYSQALVLFLGGLALTVAGFFPWTAHGVGSTQSLAQLSDLAGSEILDSQWLGRALIVPPLCGAVLCSLGALVTLDAAGVIGQSVSRQAAAIALVVVLVAMVATIALVVGLNGAPWRKPGAGFILACSAQATVLLAVGRLLLAVRTTRVTRELARKP